MTLDPLLERLAVALAIGMLIGLERGWKQRDEAEGERAAGLRTYMLATLLGALCAILSNGLGPVFLSLAFLAFAIAFTAFAWLEASAEGNVSATGTVAALLAFALGAYSILGDIRIAVAVAVTATIILALKQPLHSWLRRLTWVEIRAVLILLAMTFLLLPLLPNRTVDPYDAINPAEIWLLAIVIAALSFVGYVAVRILGSRHGVALAALAGGLASSTATTVTLARLSREQPGASRILAGGILLSSAVMVVRVIAVAGAVNVPLLAPLAWPLGAGGLVLLLAGALLLWHAGRDGSSPDLKIQNPFELGTALRLAGLIALISLFAKILGEKFGGAGLNLLAILSGIADVDAVTLSFARLSQTSLPLAAAAIGIALAVATNTVVKTGMTFVLGTPKTGWLVAAAGAAAITAGAVTHFLRVG
ncbi:MgtC/SapB family protein [Microvirga sp. 17 mud 1-3]|uniref:MgtC/SapB family protein n=1 Tax=Microvirga sp. 17 mud 1-3 TaxID=2082949 RepID=UPI000D6C6FD4|nr:MgtC/SapB family protein [Microvirga sp. 17 mud 1-3]AWM86326.1 hypothetical protein C4E04_05935 [Microvirga sp. 17 mud 1-3]